MKRNILLITEMDFTPQVYEAFYDLKKEGCCFYLLSDLDFKPRENIFEKQFVFDICSTLDTFNFVKNSGIKFDAVVTKSCEIVTPLVALLTKEFGGIGNEPSVAFHCRSKYHMRKRLAENNIPQPKFSICQNEEDLGRCIEKIGIPCVVKPVGGHSSFGTFLVNSGDLKTVKEKFNECRSYLIGQSQADIKQMAIFSPEEMKMMGIGDPVNMVSDFIVEEYMEGKEISVDALVRNGKVTIMGIADQVRMEPPFFVQVSEKMPFISSPEVIKSIEDLIKNVIHAMGISDSAAHTEIILTKEGPKIVEIACRMGSDNIHDAIYQTTGYNMMYEIIMIALGIRRDFKNLKIKAHYAMEYILPKKDGRLKDVLIPPEVINDPDITEVRVDAHPGDFLSPPPKNFDFIGYIGVKSETPQGAQEKLKTALSKIEVIYE